MGQVPTGANAAGRASCADGRGADFSLGFSLRAVWQAAKTFATAAAVAFVAVVAVTAIAPDVGRSMLAALERMYSTPVDLVRRYLGLLLAIVLGNCLAAGASSSLGAFGAWLLARVQQASPSGKRDYGVLGRASYVVMDGLCRLAGAFAPNVNGVTDFSGRSSAAVAVLAPRLSLMSSGAVLGVYLGAALVTGWLAAVWGAAARIAPHAAFELPAMTIAAAIGITMSEHLVPAADRGASALRSSAKALLTSAPYLRALGIVVALILIAAAIEVRGLG